MSITKPLFFVFIILLSLHQLHGQSTVDEFFLYEDTRKDLTAEKATELFAQNKFQKIVKLQMNVGFTSSIYWLAFENKKDRPADSLLLYIGHHHINRIHFYYVTDSAVKQQWLTGDYYPFDQRPIDATGFYFPIAKKGVYLARIDKSNESLQLSFHLTSVTKALKDEAVQKIVIAIFTGIILLLVIFGIYLYVISKSKLYLYYFLYILCGWLYVLSNAGYAFEYLWPNLPWFASKARPIFAIAPLIFFSQFLVGNVPGLKDKRILTTVKILNVVLATCIVTILFFNETGYQSPLWLRIQYFIPLVSLLYVIITFTILLLLSIKGNNTAIFYLVAISTLIISAILQSIVAIGGLNRFEKYISNYGLATGYVLEAIIITAGLVYRFNQYRVDKQHLLLEMNKRQHENTRIMLEVQEAERSNVANQLHDVAGSLLSAARLSLSTLREKELLLNNNSTYYLAKTEEAIDLVSEMVRNLSHALSPIMMKKVGFKTALEKVINIVNASGSIDAKLLVLGFDNYRPQHSNYYNALYGIIYELLNNTVKHSGAKNVLIQVAEYEDCFSLIVEDDGKGIEPGQLEKSGSLGIAGIQSKIDYFKGSLALDKNKPTGLIITIEIPINSNEI